MAGPEPTKVIKNSDSVMAILGQHKPHSPNDPSLPLNGYSQTSKLPVRSPAQMIEVSQSSNPSRELQPTESSASNPQQQDYKPQEVPQKKGGGKQKGDEVLMEIRVRKTKLYVLFAKRKEREKSNSRTRQPKTWRWRRWLHLRCCCSKSNPELAMTVKRAICARKKQSKKNLL